MRKRTRTVTMRRELEARQAPFVNLQADHNSNIDLHKQFNWENRR